MTLYSDSPYCTVPLYRDSRDHLRLVECKGPMTLSDSIYRSQSLSIVTFYSTVHPYSDSRDHLRLVECNGPMTLRDSVHRSQ